MTQAKLRVFFVIGLVFIGAVFWVQNRERLARERCLADGGRWSFDAGECDAP
ncbi:hypothetical protein AB2B41_11130 [Marimonas sp. MJW-29]|uniref:Uncharacterized protein n=1 Tax=Sulfitobacter sediminis TaxID=3234186 RepID=A0ABV3RN92_9RHOB